jgi:hypothetical protein
MISARDLHEHTHRGDVSRVEEKCAPFFLRRMRRRRRGGGGGGGGD